MCYTAGSLEAEGGVGPDHRPRRDADGDGLSNLGEFRSHTDPQDIDTDNDCIPDDDEDAQGADEDGEVENEVDD